MKHLASSFVLIILSFVFAACSDKGEEGSTTTTKQSISGHIEKGPFLQGSQVTLHELTDRLTQTGKTFSAQTSDDLGAFAFSTAMTLESQYAELQTSGYFFNEVKGQLSTSQITLRALSDLSDRSTVNVNLLTHLECDRVLKLVAEGTSFADAKLQAERELLTIFGIHAEVALSEDISLTDATQNAKVLLAVSSVLLADRSEAEFSEFIATFAQDFADNGRLDNPGLTEKLHEGQRCITPSKVVENITQFYAEKGRELTFSDFSAFVDFNGDGTAGNDIYDPTHPAQVDTDHIHAPIEGGTWRINVRADIPLYLTPIIAQDEFSFPDYVGELVRTQMSMAKDYADGVLTLTVEPASYRIIKAQKVRLYDAVGNVVVSIDVTQEGNPDGAFLGDKGTQIVKDLLRTLSEAEDGYAAVDGHYTDSFTPMSANDPELQNLWTAYYRAIVLCKTISDTFNRNSTENLLEAMCAVTEALAYYRLITFFGDVPEGGLMEGMMPSGRVSAEKLLSEYTTALKSLLPQASDSEKKGPTTPDNWACPSRHTLLILLADLHLYQHQYAEARPLLDELIQSGRYTLDSQNGKLNADSGEALLSIHLSTDAIISTYSDILLQMAECETMTTRPDVAWTYIRQVVSAKGLSITSTDPMKTIDEVRRQIHLGDGGYFAFLKRSRLFYSLGLPTWQQLLPIPQREILTNPSIGQNPGY